MLELITSLPEYKTFFDHTDTTLASELLLSVGRVRDLLRGCRPAENTVKIITKKAPEMAMKHCNECEASFPKVPVPSFVEGSLAANFGLIHKEVQDVNDLQQGCAHRFYGKDPQKEKPFIEEWLKQTAEFVFTWRNILIVLVKKGVFTPDQVNSIIFEKLQGHITKNELPAAKQRSS